MSVFHLAADEPNSLVEVITSNVPVSSNKCLGNLWWQRWKLFTSSFWRDSVSIVLYTTASSLCSYPHNVIQAVRSQRPRHWSSHSWHLLPAQSHWQLNHELEPLGKAAIGNVSPSSKVGFGSLLLKREFYYVFMFWKGESHSLIWKQRHTKKTKLWFLIGCHSCCDKNLMFLRKTLMMQWYAGNTCRLRQAWENARRCMTWLVFFDFWSCLGWPEGSDYFPDGGLYLENLPGRQLPERLKGLPGQHLSLLLLPASGCRLPLSAGLHGWELA